MDVFAESVSENVVQHMREGMVGNNFLPAGVIHARCHIITNSRSDRRESRKVIGDNCLSASGPRDKALQMCNT